MYHARFRLACPCQRDAPGSARSQVPKSRQSPGAPATSTGHRSNFGPETCTEHMEAMAKPWENDGLMEIDGTYPLVMTNIVIEHGH